MRLQPQHSFPVLVALAADIVITACNPFGPKSLDISVRMETTSYRLPPPGSYAVVSFTAVNEGSDAAYIVSCGPMPLPAVQRNMPWGWEDYTGDACVAIAGMGPALLGPGQSLSGTWRWPESGRYRFRLPYGAALTESRSHMASGPSFDIR